MTKLLVLSISFAVLLASLVFFVFGDDKEPRIIQLYQVVSETELVLGFWRTSCGADFSIEVEETSSEVRISVEASSGNGNDCLDQPVVQLDSNLGDRTVIDGFSGGRLGRVETL